MPAPKNNRKPGQTFYKLSDPDIPYEEKVKLAREYAIKNPKSFNKQLDKIAPDPYRGTRKLATMLVQQYPERFPDKDPEHIIGMLEKIAYTESKNRNIPQDKGGPGRGFYQIETTTAPTATNRYKNYQEKYLKDLSAVPLPKFSPKPGPMVWSEKAEKMVPTANVMNLSKDQQAMLALSNMSAAAHKGVIDPANPMDTWLKYHWAGGAEERPDRIAHWKDAMRTFKQIEATPNKQEYGGEITAEGKKIRKYGPRPDYMNQNPSGMTTSPITQRSIGNTLGGGYMSFGDGGWTYPANTAYPMNRKGGYILLGHEYPTYGGGGKAKKDRTPIPGAKELWEAYRNPNTVVAIPNPEMPGDTSRFFVGRPQLSGTMYVNDLNPEPAFSKMNIYQMMQDPNYSRVYQDSSLVNKYIPQYADGGWVGYPDHTMYSSGMERFDRVRNYTKYGPGGNVQPYITSNPNDPRIQAYRDSSALYSNYLTQLNALNKNNYKFSERNNPFVSFYQDFADFKLSPANTYMYKEKGKTLKSIQDPNPGKINTKLPRQVYSTKILPKGYIDYEKEIPLNNSKDFLSGDIFGEKLSVPFTPSFIDRVVTPVDYRRVFDYSNVKPKQQVILVNSQPAKKPIASPKKEIKKSEPVSKVIVNTEVANPVTISSDSTKVTTPSQIDYIWTPYGKMSREQYTKQFPGAAKRDLAQKKADGGNILPYYTSDPNDPRIQAYNDSLNAYKSMYKYYDMSKGYPRFKNENKDFDTPVFHTVSDEINYYKKNPNHGWAYFNEKDYLKTNWHDRNIFPEKIVTWVPSSNAKDASKNLDRYNQLGLGLPVYKKPKQEVIFQPKPKYNYIQHSEPLGPQNFKEETITMPNGQKILRSEFEKQYGSKVTEKQFDKKAKGGKVTWQIID